MSEGVLKFGIWLAIKVFHGGRLIVRTAMNKQAGAAGAGLLAPVGIARESLARGRVTDGPMEAVTKPDTNGPINPRRTLSPSRELVTLTFLWFASRF
jgi:hypothetical protein